MKCKYCGQEIEKDRYFKEVENRMLQNEACFECNFWLEKINAKWDKYQIPFRYKHEHYIADINPAHKNSSFKGFGGKKVQVTFDNKEIKTFDNVWYQGEIPERFWKDLPDNVTDMKWLN